MTRTPELVVAPEAPPAETGSPAIGAARPRLDAARKLRGEPVFAADRDLRGLLHGRPVLSHLAHARIRSVDAAAALALPGVVAVLTAADLPIKTSGGRADEPLARDEVVFAGQPVALVVAETEAAAEDAVELVSVDYDPLPAVVDMLAAMEPGAPPAREVHGAESSDTEMHGAAGAGRAVDEEELSVNVTHRSRYKHGDVEAALARSAVVVEGTFRTSWVHQGHIEPQVAIAWPDGEGLTVLTSSQALFWVRASMARLFGLPLASVRVEGAAVGGGFGAKFGLIEPLVAAGALAVGRPLRVALTRAEDFAATNPAPALHYELRVGADADGVLQAIAGRVVADSGAFVDSAPAAFAGGRVGGCYRWVAWDVRSYGVRTNRFGSGAYRGPTAPQGTFAIEQLVDRVAAELGIDPIELRRRNAPERGDSRIDGQLWPEVGLEQVLAAAAEQPLWRRRSELPPDEGVGVASGLFPGGKMGASATCRLDSDGGFTVVTGYVDLTGTHTTVAQIAAAVLEVDPDTVRVTFADTDTAPVSGVSGGSMVTYSLGSAVQAAAEDARRQLLRTAASMLEADEADLVIAGGSVHPRGKPDRGLTLRSLGTRLTGFGSAHPPIEGHGSTLPPDIAPSAAAAIAHVRVDRDTGRVEVLGWVAVQDVGRAINPALVEGQMRGGAAQAIGFALGEELVHDEHGQLLSGSFMTYALPRAEDVPPVECVIVEVPSPHGPLGARGIGESALVPGPAAIANAVQAACGVRMHRLPMTPERVWTALADAGADGA